MHGPALDLATWSALLAALAYTRSGRSPAARRQLRPGSKGRASLLVRRRGRRQRRVGLGQRPRHVPAAGVPSIAMTAARSAALRVLVCVRAQRACAGRSRERRRRGIALLRAHRGNRRRARRRDAGCSGRGSSPIGHERRPARVCSKRSRCRVFGLMLVEQMFRSVQTLALERQAGLPRAGRIFVFDLYMSSQAVAVRRMSTTTR